MPEENDLDFIVHVEVHNSRGGNGLSLREDFRMRECTFAELAQIMSRFHDLFKTIRRERENK